MKALPLAILLLALWHPSVSAEPAQPAQENGEAMELNVLDADPLAGDRARAEQGDVDAQYDLGRAYAIGNDVERDRSKAIKWYAAAAKAGHLEAQYALGSLFQKGWKGIPPNHREAANWFKQAAERGHVKAQWQLSLLYENGRGIKKSIVEAYRWSTIAIHAAGRDSDLWRNGSPRIYRLRWQIPGNQFPRVEKSVMAQQAEMARAQANGQNGLNGLNGLNGQNGLAKP